jgi:hypothetical protein
VSERDEQIYSRAGTARALVLLASGLAAGGSLLLCLLSLLLFDKIILATGVFAAFVLVSAVVATLLTIRARSVKGVVGLGCGILLLGAVVGLGIMLVLISRIVGTTG